MGSAAGSFVIIFFVPSNAESDGEETLHFDERRKKKNKNNNVAARMSASVLGLVWAFSRFAFFPLKARAL